MKKIYKTISLLICLIVLSSCARAAAEEITYPVLNCRKDLTVVQGEDIDISAACTIEPADAIVSFQEEFDTSELGKHSISYIISDGIHNNFALEELTYEVVEPTITCGENEELDEESGMCICKEGFVNRSQDEDALMCEVKPVCEVGYHYDDKTNTCIRNSTASGNRPLGSSNQTTAPVATSETYSGSGSDDSGSSSSGSSSPAASNPSPAPAPAPTPSPAPTPAPAPTPEPSPSGSGSGSFAPNGNSQEALDDAYNQAVEATEGHDNCTVGWDEASGAYVTVCS